MQNETDLESEREWVSFPPLLGWIVVSWLVPHTTRAIRTKETQSLENSTVLQPRRSHHCHGVVAYMYAGAKRKKEIF